MSLTSTESTGMRLTHYSATSRSSTGPLVQSNSYPSTSAVSTSPSMTSNAATPGSTGLLVASTTASTSSITDVLNTKQKTKEIYKQMAKSKQKILRNTGKEYVTAAKKNVSCAQ